jgi:hypothetical protein
VLRANRLALGDHVETEPDTVSARKYSEVDIDNVLLNAVLEEFPAWVMEQAGRDDCWEAAVLVFGVQIAAVARALERVELNSCSDWKGRLLTEDAGSRLIYLCAWAVLGAGFESNELSTLDFEQQLPQLTFDFDGPRP